MASDFSGNCDFLKSGLFAGEATDQDGLAISFVSWLRYQSSVTAAVAAKQVTNAKPNQRGSVAQGPSTSGDWWVLAFDIGVIRRAKSTRPIRTMIMTMVPARLCHDSICGSPRVDAAQTRKVVRQTLAKSTSTRETAKRLIRRSAENRCNSPRNSETMRPDCKERTPLQASSMPNIPALTSTRLPCCTAGMLSHPAT